MSAKGEETIASCKKRHWRSQTFCLSCICVSKKMAIYKPEREFSSETEFSRTLTMDIWSPEL
jgi:hypothetical protein